MSSQALSNISPTVQPSIIGSGLPPGHDRSCLTQSGNTQVLSSQFTSIQLPNSIQPDPTTHLPSGIPTDLTPHESHHTSLVISTNYGPPNNVSSAFPQSGSASQANLQNNSQQEGPHFGASNANATH